MAGVEMIMSRDILQRILSVVDVNDRICIIARIRALNTVYLRQIEHVVGAMIALDGDRVRRELAMPHNYALLIPDGFTQYDIFNIPMAAIYTAHMVSTLAASKLEDISRQPWEYAIPIHVPIYNAICTGNRVLFDYLIAGWYARYIRSIIHTSARPVSEGLYRIRMTLAAFVSCVNHPECVSMMHRPHIHNVHDPRSCTLVLTILNGILDYADRPKYIAASGYGSAEELLIDLTTLVFDLGYIRLRYHSDDLPGYITFATWYCHIRREYRDAVIAIFHLRLMARGDRIRQTLCSALLYISPDRLAEYPISAETRDMIYAMDRDPSHGIARYIACLRAQ